MSLLNYEFFFFFLDCVGDIAVLHRGTPLYGQPAWWGDEDADHSGRPEENRLDRNKEKAETGIFFSTFNCFKCVCLYYFISKSTNVGGQICILPFLRH